MWMRSTIVCLRNRYRNDSVIRSDSRLDLSLGCPRQEFLHHNPCLGGDSRHALPIILGKLFVSPRAR